MLLIYSQSFVAFWLATPVMLSWGLTEEDNSDILLGKSKVVPLGTAFLPENSCVVFLNLHLYKGPGQCLGSAQSA